MRILSVAVLACLSASLSGADGVERWSREHTNAHRALLKVFERHPNFRDKFQEESRDNAQVINDWIAFLAERGDRNTNDFVEKRGREARGIKQMHENYAEHVRSFREWIRDNTDAAQALARIPGGAAAALKTAPYEKDSKRKRKDD